MYCNKFSELMINSAFEVEAQCPEADAEFTEMVTRRGAKSAQTAARVTSNEKTCLW